MEHRTDFRNASPIFLRLHKLGLMFPAMGCCLPKNDPPSMPGISQSSDDPSFLSKIFNAIAQTGSAKAKSSRRLAWKFVELSEAYLCRMLASASCRAAWAEA